MTGSILRGSDGCLGCIIRCGRVVEFRGKKECIGSLLLNDNLESIVEFNYILNNLGMDSISTGVVIAFAMWMTEKGIGDFNIKWGNTERVRELFFDIAARRGVENELAEGVRFIERRYSLKGYGAHVKGLEIPMHDARAFFLACLCIRSPRSRSLPFATPNISLRNGKSC